MLSSCSALALLQQRTGEHRVNPVGEQVYTLEERYTMCTGTHDYIPVPNTAKVDWIFSTPGGVAMNSLYFEKGSAFSGTELADIAAAAEDAWETNVSPAVSETVTLNRTVVTDLTTDSSGQVTDVGGISGANANPQMPDNVTLAISFRTALRGRSFRGRIFHVGMPRTDVVGDSVGDSNAALFAALYQDTIDTIEAAVSGLQHVVVSLCHDGAWRTVGVTTPVIAITVDPTLDTQKNRLLGRGI